MESRRKKEIGNWVVMLGCFMLLLFAGRMRVEAAAQAGTYYLSVDEDYTNNVIYGYMLPVSSVMTASNQKVDCSTATLQISLSQTSGTTVMRRTLR